MAVQDGVSEGCVVLLLTEVYTSFFGFFKVSFDVFNGAAGFSKGCLGLCALLFAFS